MQKIIIIPDSFKGTLSSAEICRIMAEEARRVFPQAEICTIPVADGGEGTVDCFLAAIAGEPVMIDAVGPFSEPVSGKCARFGQVGIVEMAAFAGLPMAEGRLDPEKTTTYGVGLAIRALIEDGCSEILLGLGGSCTNDGGCGMAAALGVSFTDKDEQRFIPTGGTLFDIAHIDVSGAEGILRNIKITAMCDIDNPLYGSEGAAHIFAPQKGADEAMVKRLDEGLRHLAGVMKDDLGKEIAVLPGAGAAGGMGAGVVAFLGGSLRPGIQGVLDTVRFDALLEGADLVLTGEGQIDAQSLRGKVVIGVAQAAKKKGVPVVAVVGSIGDGVAPAYEMGVSAIFSINRKAEDFSVSRYHAAENLRGTMENIFRLLRLHG